MTHRPFRAIGWIGLAGVIVMVTTDRPSRGADGDLDRVLAHIRRQQDQTKVVRIRAEGKRVMHSHPYLRPPRGDEPLRPPPFGSNDIKQEFVLDFQGRRYRRAYEDVLDGEPGTWVQVFDGKKVYGSKIDVPLDQVEKTRPKRMSIISGGDHINWFTSDWWPYFASQGFIITNCDHHYYWHNIRPPVDAENLFIHGSESVAGRACDVVRTFPLGPKQSAQFFEYAVDREDGSVRRMTLWVAGGKAKDAEIRLSYRRDGDRMIPTQWTNEWFWGVAKDPYRTETMKVTAIEHLPAVDDARFSLTAESGTIVKERQYTSGPINPADNKVEKTTTYRADESGRLVEGEVVNGEFRPRRSYIWWLGGGVALVALVAGWIAYRKVRSRRSPAALPGPQVVGGSS